MSPEVPLDVQGILEKNLLPLLIMDTAVQSFIYHISCSFGIITKIYAIDKERK